MEWRQRGMSYATGIVGSLPGRNYAAGFAPAGWPGNRYKSPPENQYASWFPDFCVEYIREGRNLTVHMAAAGGRQDPDVAAYEPPHHCDPR